VADGIMNSNWYELSVQVKKQLQLIILRSQKAQKLTAFKFSEVSLDSFKSVSNVDKMQLSYQTFTYRF